MAFHGKLALVTGAASGMGQLSAWRLADGGATVAAVDVDEDGLARTVAGRPSVRGYRCDLANLEEVRATVARIRAELGAIDRVTHAAAIMPTAPLLEMPIEKIERVMRVNYEGTLHITMATLPEMVASRSGDLIFYGSLAGEVPTPHLGAYNASKAAVNRFAEVLIHENRGSGVRILLVCPPMVDTPLLKQAIEGSNPRSIQIGIEQGRLAKPDVIVRLAEEALERGDEIVFPTREAAVLHALRRFAPKLLWKLIEKAEAS